MMWSPAIEEKVSCQPLTPIGWTASDEFRPLLQEALYQVYGCFWNSQQSRRKDCEPGAAFVIFLMKRRSKSLHCKREWIGVTFDRRYAAMLSILCSHIQSLHPSCFHHFVSCVPSFLPRFCMSSLCLFLCSLHSTACPLLMSFPWCP